MNQRRDNENRFFLIAGLVLAAIVIAGFLPAAVSRPGGIGAIPLLLHVHGVVFFAWFALFVTQASLVGSGKVRQHMALGKASVLIAAAMVVLGYFVMRGAYAKPEFSIAGMSPAASLMFPFTDVVNFVIAYGLAIANRRTPDSHKRLMLLAGILIIDPAVARLVFTIGAPPPFILIIELALFLSLIGYDLATRRRPHWTSVLGVGLYFAALAAKMTVAQQPGWTAFVDAVFG